MISVNILEVRPFMAKLLASTVFDHLILREMDISTFTSFHVSGQFNEAFFTKEELEERGEQRFALWSEVKSIAFAIIKGNKTPLVLKIVFQLPMEDVEKMLLNVPGKLRTDDVGGLYFNIRFEKGELHIITGTAIKTFTMDKSLEQEWDIRVKEFLKQNEIAYEED